MAVPPPRHQLIIHDLRRDVCAICELGVLIHDDSNKELILSSERSSSDEEIKGKKFNLFAILANSTFETSLILRRATTLTPSVCSRNGNLR